LHGRGGRSPRVDRESTGQARGGGKGANTEETGGRERGRMMKKTTLLVASLWLVALFATAQAAKGPAAQPTPAPSTPKPPESIGQTLLEQEELANTGRAYTYDPAGRRDPFRSLLIRQPNRPGGQRPPGIAGIAVDEVIVQGIWKTRAGYV